MGDYGSEEWARTITVPLASAICEYKRNGFTEADLISDLGRHETYQGAAVLDALGY